MKDKLDEVKKLVNISKHQFGLALSDDALDIFKLNRVAGMFDSDGNILGVVSKAMVVIGGKDHAKLMLVTNVGKE